VQAAAAAASAAIAEASRAPVNLASLLSVGSASSSSSSQSATSGEETLHLRRKLDEASREWSATLQASNKEKGALISYSSELESRLKSLSKRAATRCAKSVPLATAKKGHQNLIN
jgi:hypothetical protein